MHTSNLGSKNALYARKVVISVEYALNVLPGPNDDPEDNPDDGGTEPK
jgi:hypothetical protein